MPSASEAVRAIPPDFVVRPAQDGEEMHRGPKTRLSALLLAARPAHPGQSAENQSEQRP